MPIGKGKIALAGLAAVAAIAAIGFSKKEIAPSSGKKWRLVFGVHPHIDSEAEFNDVEKTARYMMAQSGLGEVIDFDYPAPNTIEMTVRYIKNAEPMPVGAQLQIGKYDVVVSERYQV